MSEEEDDEWATRNEEYWMGFSFVRDSHPRMKVVCCAPSTACWLEAVPRINPRHPRILPLEQENEEKLWKTGERKKPRRSPRALVRVRREKDWKSMRQLKMIVAGAETDLSGRNIGCHRFLVSLIEF